MSLILAELMMMKWEEENIDKEGRIIKFMRYMDDRIRTWKGKEKELKEKVKEHN